MTSAKRFAKICKYRFEAITHGIPRSGHEERQVVGGWLIDLPSHAQERSRRKLLEFCRSARKIFLVEGPRRRLEPRSKNCRLNQFAPRRSRHKANANIGIGTTSPTNPLQMEAALVTTAGFGPTRRRGRTRRTSRRYRLIQPSKPQESSAGHLQIQNRQRKRVGFIAEDVPDIVASKDRKD